MKWRSGRHRIPLRAIGPLLLLTLLGACGGGGSGSSSNDAVSSSSSTTTTTLAPTTTTTVDPQIVAMVAWAAENVDDLTAIQGAISNIVATGEEVSSAAGRSVDNYLDNPDTADVLGDSNAVLAALEQQKAACATLASVVKTAQTHLPAPLPTFNEAYSSALENSLDASRACRLGDIEDTTSYIVKANADLVTAASAIAGLP